MPNGSPSFAAGLGSVGAGLMDTFFSGLKQDKDKADADKKYEKELQMRALHDLIASGTTQVADIPRLMQMHADLAGIGNLPGVKESVAHMKQAAAQSVPYGPEQTRTVDKSQLGIEPPTPAPQGLQVSQPQLMSVPSEPTPSHVGVSAVMAQPKALASDLLGANHPQVTLRTVPTEETYQPTRIAGELSQDELDATRKSQADIAHQTAMFKRQSELAEAAGDRQGKRDAERNLAQLEQIRARAEESRKTQNQLFENKIKMLEPEVQAHAQKRVYEIAATLNPAIPYEERLQEARDTAFSEVQLGIATKKAQIDKSKAEVKHWANIDARALVSKGGAATQGMSAGQMRQFRLNTIEILPDLHAVQTQLQKLQSDQALLGGQDPAIQARIKELSDRQDELLLRVKQERDKVMAPAQSAPSTPGARQSAKPASDPLGLFK